MGGSAAIRRQRLRVRVSQGTPSSSRLAFHARRPVRHRAGAQPQQADDPSISGGPPHVLELLLLSDEGARQAAEAILDASAIGDSEALLSIHAATLGPHHPRHSWATSETDPAGI